jgi:uncharacterized protein YegP (UPF0339 family)
MKSKSLKPLPQFASDQEAENFVDHADLTAFDLSTGKTHMFEKIGSKQAVRDDYAFVISSDTENSFRFEFRSSSGEVLFASAAFQSKDAALKAIETFRAAISSASTRDTSDAAA